MRVFLVGLALSLCAGCASSPSAGSPIESQRARWLAADASQVLVVAHRGCWRDAPENSIEALEACIAMGVDMVEVDVRRTRDGVLVVMHDDTVDRTTDGTGRVEDLTLETIRNLRLRAGAGGAEAALTQARVPTFETYMSAARGRMLINLDAKADVYDDAFAVLERLGTSDHILMKRRVGPDDPSLVSMPPFDRVLAMAILDQERGEGSALAARQLSPAPSGFELIFTDIAFAKAVAPLAEQAGVRLWVNTLREQFAAGLIDQAALQDPDAVWGRLVALGFDTIQTDEPEILLQYLQSRGLR